ncbi:MAG: Gfo/Idh/MocA family oxidoreductase [Anaerolineae bacterium]|nr:Gfo/Idh/MocA family oxidoreductase [Anaerolineae bacterium]
MENKIKVGIIGTGNISPAYFKGCRAFDILDLVACADIDLEKARHAQQEYNIPKVYSVEDLLADPEIQIVINLTIPAVHAGVSLSILQAGKHVYSEKPFAVKLEDGQKILQLAQEKGLRTGCAPDTFMFGPHQTCRKLIDDGAIGQPVAASAHMASHGPEAWHPNPDFFYQVGGGPLFDMGPYYITCLVNLLGAVKRVAASTRISFPERVAESKGNEGRRLKVDVPTHYAGVLDFASGAVASYIVSFDVWKHHLPMMEVYGSEGSLSVPDPNGYSKDVGVSKRGGDWQIMPQTHREEWARGIGVADMAYGILYGRPHRATGEMAYHVLEVMHAFEQASTSGQHVMIQSSIERPQALPTGLQARVLDQ